ncbi:MAG: hypothetical protein QXL94_01740 [Candidatus Parvarchaeum sp.]
MLRIYGTQVRYPAISFTLIANYLVNGLIKKGYEAELENIFGASFLDGAERRIFIPFHYRQDWNFDGAYLWGIADNDKFNEDYIARLKKTDYKAFIVPSEFVAKVFGVPRTTVIKLGLLDDIIPALKKKVSKRYTFYLNASHSWQRRGMDLAIKALDEVYASGKSFSAVLHLWDRNEIEVKRPWLRIVDGVLPAEEHYKLMSQSEFLLHPARGGAYEIPILEALALGVTPIIPNVKPFNEIPLSSDDVYYIKWRGNKELYWHNQWHTGLMYSYELTDVVEAINIALVGKAKEIDREKYLEGYSREKKLEEWLKVLEL